MKKRALLLSIFLVFALVFVSSFLFAQAACEDGDNSCKLDRAYSCLNEKIDNKGCSSLSSEEKVFSALATGDCRSDLTSDSNFKKNTKYTAQAILALGGNSDGEDWLLNDATGNPSEINWFLQIDSTGPTTCTLSPGGKVISINEDKKIEVTGSLPSCLHETNDGYWLSVDSSSSCRGKEFTVSCDQSFVTSLLYQKQDSSTVYVSENTHSSSAQGETTEMVNSSCFKQGSSCDYEASLWAALVMDSRGEDISSYIPYLITMADDNEESLPDAFLYLLTGDFGSELLAKQKGSKWWEESSGNRYYDTALALYALQYDDSPERTASLDWLYNEAQGGDGCWNNGNIRDTAFLLYSIEPRASGGSGGGVTCTEAGGYCLSSFSCTEAGGTTISSASCSGTFVCCSQPKELKSCEDQSGEICNSGQNCVGGTTAQASGLSSGQVCCVQGTCETPSTQASSCEVAGGTCRISGCLGDEQESFESCEGGNSFATDTCCIQSSGGISGWWILLLLILIALVVVGIIYRDRLRKLWFRIKSRFLPKGGSSTSKPSTRRPPGRPPMSSMARRGPMQRRIIPGPMSSPTPRGLPPRQKPRKELDDVLKKLREMGK